MARTFLTPVDFSRLEALNLRVQNLATAPTGTLTAGMMYWNTTDSALYVYNGSAWVNCSEQNIALDFGEASDISSSAPGDTAAAGSSTTEVAAADHRHARTDSYGSSASSTTVGGSGGAGSSAAISRADHSHALAGGTVTSQTSFSASATDGVSTAAARADHAHGTPSHTAHDTLSLSTFTAPTGSVSFGSQNLTNLADPVNAQDAATRAFVESMVQGLSWKDAVRVVATSSVTLSGTQTIDGVSLAVDDRVLVIGNTTDNGIWVVASGSWTRATDANTIAKLAGAAVLVTEGSSGAGKQYTLTTDGGTLGSTNLVWTQFGAGSTYGAGNGLSLNGSDFDVNVKSGGGIKITSDELEVDTAVVARKYSTPLSTSATSYTISHGLGTKDVIVQVFGTDATGAQVECDVEHDSTSSLTLRFASAPTANSLRVIVVG